MLSKRILFEALDSLAFIFSSQYDKFKPQVSLHYQIFNPETNRSSSGWRRLQDFGIFKMETSNLEYISKIRIFLERKEKFSRKLANSLTWYHKALGTKPSMVVLSFFGLH